MKGKIVETQNLAAKYDCKINFPKTKQVREYIKQKLIEAENRFIVGENSIEIYVTKKYKIPVILSYMESSKYGTAFSISSGWGETEYIERIKINEVQIYLEDGTPALKKMTRSLQGRCGIVFFKKMFKLYEFPRLCKKLKYNISWNHCHGGITVPFEKEVSK